MNGEKTIPMFYYSGDHHDLSIWAGIKRQMRMTTVCGNHQLCVESALSKYVFSSTSHKFLPHVQHFLSVFLTLIHQFLRTALLLSGYTDEQEVHRC